MCQARRLKFPFLLIIPALSCFDKKKLKFRLLKYVFVIQFSFKILYKYIIYYFESIIFKNLIKNIYYDLTYNFFYNLLSKIKIKFIIN